MPKTMTEEHPPEDRIDPWKRAQQFLKGLGDISTTFTTCVRSLNSEGTNVTGSNFNIMSHQQLQRLMRSPTVISHLYYAALTYRKDKIEALGSFTPMQMIEVFNASELAALLTIVFAHRKITVRCDEKEWNSLSSNMQLYLDLAMPLGITISSIGTTRAFLVAAARSLGWGAIMAHDLKGFKKYKVAIKVRGVPFDINEEVDNWGTSHAHIAASLYQMFGFGIGASSSLLKGLINEDLDKLEEDERRFKVAQIWLDALVIDRTVPDESVGDDYLISDSQLEPFVEFVHNLLDNGSPHTWLDKRRSDLSSERTPNLKLDYKRLPKSNSGAETGAMEADSGLEEDMA